MQRSEERGVQRGLCTVSESVVPMATATLDVTNEWHSTAAEQRGTGPLLDEVSR